MISQNYNLLICSSNLVHFKKFYLKIIKQSSNVNCCRFKGIYTFSEVILEINETLILTAFVSIRKNVKHQKIFLKKFLFKAKKLGK